jgi:type III restriction enzyme
MKIQFNPNLNFQKEAISSITDIFKGQEVCQTNFTVAPLKNPSQSTIGKINNEGGVGNKLELLDEDISENVRDIQLRNGLKPSDNIDINDLNFTVEMETGTGKTYVYLRTIFEMNQLYGFTKFIIVVPSVAIKEGVYKSLQMTEEHFRGLYKNIPFDYFIYDSQKLGQVRSFATSDTIQIMVINIDAFRKSFKDPEKEDKANIIHRPHDRMNGSKPIEYIQETNSVVIIDEPQSVDTTEKSKQAIGSLNPLCTLRYSATHVDKHHMVYKLDSVDAYEKKLVKQIEVAGIDVEDHHNKAYIKLLSVDNKKSPIKARIEIDILQKNGTVKRQVKTIRSGDDLLDISGGRDVYDGYIIEDIYCEPGKEYISFTSKPDIIRLEQSIGSANENEHKRLQIRKTIEEHLEKEKKLRPKGIKVLSLFFIDKVANYRFYDDEGKPQKGKFASIFEEEYKRIIKKPKYEDLLEGTEPEIAAQRVHNGYFAIDKKKDANGTNKLKESKGEGKTQADESAYQLIMRDKEKLLSFDSKLKFIFSHSALREGWDNPNVFQICTLNETSSVIKKRQEIGRGLRIAVNQDGERVHGFDVNTLTVMANESYESFAEQLQKEIEEEEGIKFGMVEKHLFGSVVTSTNDHKTNYLGVDASEKIWDHLESKGYIDNKGRVQDTLRSDLIEDKVDIPEEYSDVAGQIKDVLKKVSGNLNVKNANNKKKISPKRAVLESEEFKELWDKIKYKTTFRVNFDINKLIEECTKEIDENLVVGKARFRYSKAETEIDRGGVHTSLISESTSLYDINDYVLPDIITYLQNETNLTRRTLIEILRKSSKLSSFTTNPQQFIEQVSAIIKQKMQIFIVDGIKYEKIGDDNYYAQELFEENELYGYLKKNMLESQKSVYDHIVYDSDVEAEFAKSLELDSDVKVYTKLPNWFKIDTPLGNYNPDWAILIEKDGNDKLYFVLETKGSVSKQKLRGSEQGKIECGKKHFEAINKEIDFVVADNYDTFQQNVYQ